MITTGQPTQSSLPKWPGWSRPLGAPVHTMLVGKQAPEGRLRAVLFVFKRYFRQLLVLSVSLVLSA
jgi:hypothetical protein